MSEKKVKVGVMLRVNGEKGKQSLWENGIFQNCFFLTMLFQRAPHVQEAYVVLAGTGDKESREHFAGLVSGVQFLHEEQAAQVLDVIIEMSINLNDQYVPAFLARGGKLVGAKVGNDYVIDTERVVFELAPASVVRQHKLAAVWTIPEYIKTGVKYFETLHRAPVRVLPHLWSPYFMERMATVKPDLKFEYQPNPGKIWRAAIFEPNICMVKTSFIPMLACEYANSRDPKALGGVLAFNTKQFTQGHQVFIDTVGNLDIQSEAKLSYEARISVFEAMALYTNLVVSHQLENAQNYLYYELLWAGYPLVHNSPLLEDCGYYYPDFDTEAGGLAILRAIRTHDANLAEYKRKAAAYIAELDPFHPDNIDAYDRALVEVINSD